MSKKEAPELTIKNIDTGEILTIDDASSRFDYASINSSEKFDWSNFKIFTISHSLYFRRENKRPILSNDGLTTPDMLFSQSKEQTSRDSNSSKKSNQSKSDIPKKRKRRSKKSPSIIIDDLDIPPDAKIQFIRISGYKKKGKGSSVYVSYTLEVRCSSATPVSGWSVQRRYKQFKALNDALRSEGYRVPILPPRRLLGGMDPEFVDHRQQELETWMYSLIQHSAIDLSALDPHDHPAFKFEIL